MKKTSIILHHSGTPDQAHDDWAAIRRYHTSWRYHGNIVSAEEASDLKRHGATVEAPWRDIAYHLGVERLEGQLVLRVGRGLGDDGAHCYQQGMNKTAIGLCIVGNFDNAAPDAETLWFAVHHLKPILSDLGIVASKSTIRMHREFAGYKTCPGTMFPYDSFLSLFQQF